MKWLSLDNKTNSMANNQNQLDEINSNYKQIEKKIHEIKNYTWNLMCFEVTRKKTVSHKTIQQQISLFLLIIVVY